jgi:hypothetical protein
MRGVAGSVICSCLIGALVPRAAAQAGPALSVTRGPGAEECPDTTVLSSRIEQLGSRPGAAPVAYEVSFTRDHDGFTAAIRTSADGGAARILRDRGATCAALAQAAAVTLALLLDPSARSDTALARVTPRAPSVPPSPVTAAAEEPVLAAQAAASAPEGTPVDAGWAQVAPASPIAHEPADAPTLATLSLGVAGVVGVVRPVAPALAGELGVALGRVRLGAGVLWIAPQSLELGPGQVAQSLLSGVARPCLALLRGAGLRFDACSGIHAGVLRANADAYTRNDEASELWLALPFELALAGLNAPLGWELGASVLVPLRRHDFVIDNLGVVYESTAVAMMIALRGFGLWVL